MDRHFIDSKTQPAQFNRKQQANQDIGKSCLISLEPSPALHPSKLNAGSKMKEQGEKHFQSSPTFADVLVDKEEPIQVVLTQHKKCNAIKKGVNRENVLIWKTQIKNPN